MRDPACGTTCTRAFRGMDFVLALFKAGTGRGVFITFVSIAEGPYCVLGRTEPI